MRRRLYTIGERERGSELGGEENPMEINKISYNRQGEGDYAKHA